MAKALERKNDIFGTFICENNGNYEKRKVKGHRLHVRRKLKENEENEILIDRKASEDQLASLVSSVLNLSLSLSHTLGYFEFPWTTLGWCGILGFLE